MHSCARDDHRRTPHTLLTRYMTGNVQRASTQLRADIGLRADDDVVFIGGQYAVEPALDMDRFGAVDIADHSHAGPDQRRCGVTLEAR
ncbi:hypothetical protein GY26_06670 [Gammaproteobacteria bacterium MFB021]|nr:hypothetical protein GY26_06670 [Gammaproteobacteria bacterium MFB021]